MRTSLYTTLFALIALSTSFALTPKERDLVRGLTSINTDLRAQVAAYEGKSSGAQWLWGTLVGGAASFVALADLGLALYAALHK